MCKCDTSMANGHCQTTLQQPSVALDAVYVVPLARRRVQTLDRHRTLGQPLQPRHIADQRPPAGIVRTTGMQRVDVGVQLLRRALF